MVSRCLELVSRFGMMWYFVSTCMSMKQFFKTQTHDIPGSFQSSCHREGWHSRHREGCWKGPFHKQLVLHLAGQPLWSASSAKTPVKLPPHLLECTGRRGLVTTCCISIPPPPSISWNQNAFRQLMINSANGCNILSKHKNGKGEVNSWMPEAFPDFF